MSYISTPDRFGVSFGLVSASVLVLEPLLCRFSTRNTSNLFHWQGVKLEPRDYVDKMHAKLTTMPIFGLTVAVLMFPREPRLRYLPPPLLSFCFPNLLLLRLCTQCSAALCSCCSASGALLRIKLSKTTDCVQQLYFFSPQQQQRFYVFSHRKKYTRNI